MIFILVFHYMSYCDVWSRTFNVMFVVVNSSMSIINMAAKKVPVKSEFSVIFALRPPLRTKISNGKLMHYIQ